MEIRKAVMDDLKQVAAVEAACFPAAEAATEEQFRQRLAAYGAHFLLLFDEGKLVGFIDGMVTDEKDLTDAMYEDASMHREDGAWQMIFGLNTIPERRREGLAARLMRAFIEEARQEGRQGVCSPVKSGSSIITGDSDLLTKAYPVRNTAARCGTRCGWSLRNIEREAVMTDREMLEEARRTIAVLRGAGTVLERELEEIRTHCAGESLTAEALYREITQMRAALAERDARIAALEEKTRLLHEQKEEAESGKTLPESELAPRLQFYYRDFLRVSPKKLTAEDAARLYEVLKYLFRELKKAGLVIKEK